MPRRNKVGVEGARAQPDRLAICCRVGTQEGDLGAHPVQPDHHRLHAFFSHMRLGIQGKRVAPQRVADRP